LELEFDEEFFELDTPEKIAQFEQSISAKTGIPLEEIQAMDPKVRAKFRDQFKGAGANLQMRIGDEVVPGKYIQYFSRKADLHTAKHEAIHFLRQSGLMTQAEFDTLSQRYAPDAKSEQDREEAIAYAFEEYHAAAEERRQENRVGVFDRIKEFFGKARVVDEVSGIFNAVERGAVAARLKPATEPAKDLMDVDESVDTLDPYVIPLPPPLQSQVDLDAEPDSTYDEFRDDVVDPQFSVQTAGASELFVWKFADLTDYKEDGEPDVEQSAEVEKQAEEMSEAKLIWMNLRWPSPVGTITSLIPAAWIRRSLCF
jgi:hypothetical protein